MELSYCVLLKFSETGAATMEAKKDLSTRLDEMSLAFRELEAELSKATELDAPALQKFRHSLDDLRMTAWTVSELMTARTTEKDPGVVMSFLAAERLRRYNQMTHELSNDMGGTGYTWETSGIHSLHDSINRLQARLTSMVANQRSHAAKASKLNQS